MLTKRVLSFGRRQRGSSPSASSDGARPHSPIVHASALPTNPEPPKKGISIRRNLSFRREKGTQGTQAHGPIASRVPSTAGGEDGAQKRKDSWSNDRMRQLNFSARPSAIDGGSPNLGGIRRTFSWQRGHKQAQRAAAKTAANASRALTVCAPVLLEDGRLPRLMQVRLATVRFFGTRLPHPPVPALSRARPPHLPTHMQRLALVLPLSPSGRRRAREPSPPCAP